MSIIIGLAILYRYAPSLERAQWRANSGMKAMFDALNVAYGEEERRGFFGLNLRAICFTLGAVAFILLGLGAIVVIPAILQFVGQSTNRTKAIDRSSVMAGVIPTGHVLAAVRVLDLHQFYPSRCSDNDWEGGNCHGQ
jgi:membrane protein